MPKPIRTGLGVLRLAAQLWRLLGAILFGVLRLTFRGALVARDGVRLLFQRNRFGHIRCPNCRSDIETQTARECRCGFRSWGDIFVPCRGCAQSVAYIHCPHCGFSLTNPYLLGADP